MRALEFIEKLKKLEIVVFSVVDAERIINKPRNYVRLYLHRLEKEELIVRIEKNRYATKGADVWVVAANLVKPSYISFLSAFYLHHMTTQIPIRIKVVASVSKKPIIFEEHEIDFIKFRQNRIFGYRKHPVRDGQVFIAEREKAVVDSLYLQKGTSASDVNGALPQCDAEKLVSYAMEMNSKALIQRLGYLLELNKIEIPTYFLGRIGKNYVLLNPSLPKKGEKNPRWRVIANEVLE